MTPDEVLARLKIGLDDHTVGGRVHMLEYQTEIYKLICDYDAETQSEAAWTKRCNKLLMSLGGAPKATSRTLCALLRRILHDIDVTNFLVFRSGRPLTTHHLDVMCDKNMTHIPIYRRLDTMQRWQVIANMSSRLKTGKATRECPITDGLMTLLQKF